MKAKQHKFQVLAVGGKTFDKEHSFRIGKTEIECEGEIVRC